MLRRSKKVVKRLVDDTFDPAVAIRPTESERVQVTDNVSLESTVFGGESRITEHLQSSGFKVSAANRSVMYFILLPLRKLIFC